MNDASTNSTTPTPGKPNGKPEGMERASLEALSWGEALKEAMRKPLEPRDLQAVARMRSGWHSPSLGAIVIGGVLLTYVIFMGYGFQ